MNRKVFKLWVKRSAVLLWGMLVYNAFVALVLTPLFRKWFPPLTGWERVTKLFTGASRTTYRDILPYAGPALWIAGNALLFALIHRELNEARGTLGGPGGKPADVEKN
ncbi:MAG: hypothetical protein V1798_01945 [Pseudomonadota bacterium]